MSEDLRQRILNVAVQSNIALGISLADRLGIFPALGKTGSEAAPAHYDAVAKEAGLKPRYTKELLALLACGDIITVTPDGDHFYMSPAAAEVLNSPIKDKGVSLCLFVPMHAQVFNPISEVFQLNGPLGMEYANYGDFYGTMDELSASLHKKHLVPDLVPLTGMKEALEAGISFLDPSRNQPSPAGMRRGYPRGFPPGDIPGDIPIF
uniref:Methyltranfer_dom domain-containing protein n=1 Tax=Panagrellus redivivus TaxID=6233 RepID=A0A7E4ZZE7_PANRE